MALPKFSTRVPALLLLLVGLSTGRGLAGGFDRDRAGDAERFLDTRAQALHLFVAGSRQPRVIFAWPPDNTGAGIWFASARAGGSVPRLRLLAGPVEIEEPGLGLGARVSLDLGVEAAAVEAVLVGSVRALRDYAGSGAHPWDGELAAASALCGDDSVLASLKARLEAARRIAPRLASDGTARLERESLAGGTRYLVRLGPGPGTTMKEEKGRLVLRAHHGTATLEVAAAQSRPRLEAFPAARLLAKATTGAPARAIEGLSFLATGEKLLAGSWRYLTYFGRDTLLTGLLLADRLSPELLDVAIDSVLVRLSQGGEVAHEEDLGEQATRDRLRDLVALAARRGRAATRRLLAERLGRLGQPVYDYGMVDDDFMLAPLVAARLRALAPEARGAWLAHPVEGRRTRLQALETNLTLVADRLAGRAPSGLLEGHVSGDWRDSKDGLGGGRRAYSIDVAWMPAAARALVDLAQGGLISGAPGPSENLDPSREAAARRPYLIELPMAEACRRAEAYLGSLPRPLVKALREQPLPQGGTLGELLSGKLKPPPGAVVLYEALALDRRGAPIPVMHSDGLLRAALGLADPTDELLLTQLKMPFPLGLATPAGVLVANPGLSGDPGLWRRFGPDAYHGTVAWGWVQPLAARALGLSSAPHQEELWGLGLVEGRLAPVPYGVGPTAATESNALQLWSLLGALLP